MSKTATTPPILPAIAAIADFELAVEMGLGAIIGVDSLITGVKDEAVDVAGAVADEEAEVRVEKWRIRVKGKYPHLKSMNIPSPLIVSRYDKTLFWQNRPLEELFPSTW